MSPHVESIANHVKVQLASLCEEAGLQVEEAHVHEADVLSSATGEEVSIGGACAVHVRAKQEHCEQAVCVTCDLVTGVLPDGRRPVACSLHFRSSGPLVGEHAMVMPVAVIPVVLLTNLVPTLQEEVRRHRKIFEAAEVAVKEGGAGLLKFLMVQTEVAR